MASPSQSKTDTVPVSKHAMSPFDRVVLENQVAILKMMNVMAKSMVGDLEQSRLLEGRITISEDFLNGNISSVKD